MIRYSINLILKITLFLIIFEGFFSLPRAVGRANAQYIDFTLLFSQYYCTYKMTSFYDPKVYDRTHPLEHHYWVRLNFKRPNLKNWIPGRATIIYASEYGYFEAPSISVWGNRPNDWAISTQWIARHAAGWKRSNRWMFRYKC